MKKFGTAVILAGGKSSRMGFDKQFLEINGVRLLDNIFNILSKEFNDLIIITNKPEEYKNYKARILVDEIKDKGPLAGIYTGLKHAKSEYVFFTPCDIPEFQKGTAPFFPYLARVKRGCPLLGFYSKRLLEKIKDSIDKDKLSVHKFLQEINCLYVETEKDIINLNTREDLKNFYERYDKKE